ncbi:MAG TPA: baseplate J/gp47 family protein, partial [Isosphaeraceae bacterium]|nr:baseplate J/gp47 family protein [Isosphaeraceae bacterium]
RRADHAPDDRRFQDLRDEAVARIAVHNPEWTNYGKSDPGITLLELFAFFFENLAYRANQIPDRNRRKFLTLLGLGLQPGSSAQGLVTFSNDRGPLSTVTLTNSIEVRAGTVPFRTTLGLDVLPVEAQIYFKRALASPSSSLLAYYQQLYMAFLGQPPTDDVQLYETVALAAPTTGSVDLGTDTVDGALWIALLVRENDQADASAPDLARQQLLGRTLNVGFVPALDQSQLDLPPGGQSAMSNMTLLEFDVPNLAIDPIASGAQYLPLQISSTNDVLATPGVVQVTLPAANLGTWTGLSPLEAGVDDLPPTLDDTDLASRLIAWIRVRSTGAAQARLYWAGINAVPITQRGQVVGEVLPHGTGEPDQTATLSQTPVLPDSVVLTITPTVTSPLSPPHTWLPIDDLMSAGPEVPTTDPTLPPGTTPAANTNTQVFTIDPESGVIQFGDGTHGARPPLGATIRADYFFGVGSAGNVGAGAIDGGPALPSTLTVTNPVPTWGGADAQTVADGFKQIPRYLQNRDRLVTDDDFRAVALRTPGVSVGRVEVLPAYSPELDPNTPGDSPGTVTLMLIPTYDPANPNAPMPDTVFMDTVAAYLDPRRLVTTELYLYPPAYVPIWISVGLKPAPNATVAVVRDAVKQALLQFLSPLPGPSGAALADVQPLLTAPSDPASNQGWPLLKPVVAAELLAVASRVAGVLLVNQVLIAQGTQPAATQINMTGLQLPQVAGISVSVGDAVPIDQVRGTATSAQPTPTPTPGTQRFHPVPAVPDQC